MNRPSLAMMAAQVLVMTAGACVPKISRDAFVAKCEPNVRCRKHRSRRSVGGCVPGKFKTRARASR